MNLKMLKTALTGLVLSVSGFANAGLIGTFDERAGLYGNGSYFSLIGGTHITNAANALINDGFSFVNLDAEITSAALSNLDSVYLSLAVSNVLSSAEVLTLSSYVNDGGLLVVQADYNSGYQNLLSHFGVTPTSVSALTGIQNVVNDYAPITNGEYGTVSSIYTASSNKFIHSGTSLANGSVGVLEAGLGKIVLFGDVNTFDDHSNGFNKEDDANLWRNTFAMSQSVDVPEPSTLAIFALGIIGLASRRFKKQ